MSIQDKTLFDAVCESEENLLSARAYGILSNNKILTLGELANHTLKDLLRYRGTGRVSINQMKALLAHYGLSLKAE